MTDELRARLARTRFPRTSRYDPRWVISNVMGPQPLWLMEWLCSELDLAAGARVLDLGCGKALTSVFLAREYDLRVVAADLWIPPSENWTRIKDAGCVDGVIPVHAQAHDLKFADEYRRSADRAVSETLQPNSVPSGRVACTPTTAIALCCPRLHRSGTQFLAGDPASLERDR